MNPAFVRAAFVSFVAIGGTAGVYGPAVPELSQRLGVGVAAAGLAVPAHNLGALLGILWWGRGQGRVPAGRLLVVGTVALVVGGLGVAAAGWLPLLLACVAVAGVGFGLVDVGVNTVLQREPGRVGRFNALHATFGLGAVLLPVVVGRLGLAAAMGVVVLLSALSAPGLRTAAEVDRPPPGRGADRPTRGLVLLLSVSMGVEVGAPAWAPTHLVGTGLTPAGAANVVAGLFLAYTATRYLVAPFVGRFDPRSVVRASLVASVVVALLAGVEGFAPYAWVLVGVTIAPVFPTALAWLGTVSDDPRGTTRVMVGASVGAVVAPAAIGGLVAVLGTGVVPVAIAVVALVAGVVAHLLPPARGGSREPAGAGAVGTLR